MEKSRVKLTEEERSDLGLLTAVKEADMENKEAAILLSILAGRDARWTKNSIVEASSNVSDF